MKRAAIRPKEQAMLLVRLASLYGAGLPAVEAFQIAGLPGEVTESVSNGSKVADAFLSYFSPEVIPVIRSGEMSGDLASAFRSSSDILAGSEEFRASLVKSLAYPSAVLATCFAGMVFFSLFVIPQMVAVFDSAGAGRPPSVSFISALPVVMAGLLAVSVLAGTLWNALSRAGIAVKERELLTLRLPLAGRMIRSVTTAGIIRLLASLLVAGIPLRDALAELASAERSVLYREALIGTIADIENGRPLSSSLDREPLSDPALIRAVLAGERSGDLGSALRCISQVMAEDARTRISVLAGFIEPAATVLVGLFVGTVALAMISPMASVLSSLQ